MSRIIVSRNLLTNFRIINRAKFVEVARMQQNNANYSEYACKSMVDMDHIQKLRNLEEINPDTYRANFFGARPASARGSGVGENIYGGLLFAQAMLAAENTVDSQFEPHAIHAFFTLNGTPDKPIDYKVERIRDGRSFINRSVKACQNGNVVFTAQTSLCKKEPPSIEHQQEMPKVPQPDQVKPYFHEARRFLHENESGVRKLEDFQVKSLQRKIDEDEPCCVFEFRPIEPTKFMSLESWKPQPMCYWMRTVLPIPSDEQQLHRFLVTYITDATLVSAANTPHMSHSYRPSMLFTLDHTVHFHDHNYRADEWLLYENLSRVAKNGRGFSEGRVWTQDGRLVISTSQESLSRTKTEPSKL
ncbi:thioesterase-like superfamily domain-containing protein [Ditylenchus destructor]|uniref:Thioesterase-like superfamily domain-containing protein n=1 Tax=Ditylenchus destructor TaxID=166010 RepID=A0AAD4QZZ0_9BILA|nr:thioesterase-like superfamily domain-containing protein [Ditylenchus destructor]